MGNTTGRWRLNTVWGLAVVALVIMTFKFEPNTREFLGVVASNEVITSSKSGGRVTSIYVKSGDKVKEGQLLAKLEDISLEIEINKAEFELNNLLAKLAINQRIAGKSNKPKSTQDPITLQIKQLKRDLQLRRQQKKSQSIKAVSDAVVGQVHAKEGQYMAPYQEVITLYAPKSEIINGYIHEDGKSNLSVSDSVEIISASNLKKKTIAKVKNLGKRLTEFPERLRPNPSITTWGREVIIQLPENHGFLASEKVIIREIDAKLARKHKSSEAAKHSFN